MGTEQWRTLGLWAVIALAAGGMGFLWYRLRTRRQQRAAVWRELCLRLELVPEPGDGRVASGQCHGRRFILHDTGSCFLLEVPLPRPLLPPDVVLLSAKARRLRPRHRLRPLRVASEPRPRWWGFLSPPPNTLAWYGDWDMPQSRAEASVSFLQEARCAAEAHAPLRVEPRRLVQTLGTGDLPSVEDVHRAVRALDATARRWLDAVGAHGLPRVQILPWMAPASWFLWDVVEERAPWLWLFVIINAGLPFAWVIRMMGVGIFLMVLWLPLTLIGKRALEAGLSGLELLVLCALTLSSSLIAPHCWVSGDAQGRLMALFFWGVPNMLILVPWVGVVFVQWRQDVREFRRGREV